MAADQQHNVDVVEPMDGGFFCSLVTQSSTFEGRLWDEAWYGFHNIWKRIFAFVALSTVAVGINTLQDLASFEIPVLSFGALSDQELQSIRDSRLACAQSLCEVAKTITFDCVMDENGRVSVDNVHGATSIPMTEECQRFVEKTLGPKFMPGGGFTDRRSSFFALFEIRDGDAAITSATSSSSGVLELKPSCTISFTEEFIGQAEIGNDVRPVLREVGKSLQSIALYDRSEQQHERDNRQTFSAERLLCLETTLAPDTVKIIASVGDWLFRNRLILYVGTVFCASWMYHLFNLSALMFALLWRALILRYCLWWPKTLLGGRKVTVISIWKTLILINVLTQKRSGGLGDLLLVGCLIASCVVLYNDKRAAVEWAFLASLWVFAETIAFPILDGLPEIISKFDKLNLVPLMASIIGWFVPPETGYGWWKLVTLNAYYKAYPMKHKFRRIFPAFLGGSDAETERVHLKVD